MKTTYTISGDDSLEKMFKILPEKVKRKVVLATFRKAAKPFLTALKSKYKGRLKKVVGTKAGKNKEYPNLAAGVMSKKKVTFKSGSGSELPGFLIAYWQEHGTLSNRDSAHNFVKPRRKKSKNWKGGIQKTDAVEKAWKRNAKQSENIVNKEFKNILVKTLKKYAV